MSPKVYALYLPQFHETLHNNQWWGEGFTDWLALKKAEKLFEGHEQPEIPLNGNYYDLSNIDALRFQADIAHKYGVDGFIFYHYYFGDGKLELEKPAENLLEHPDVKLPFCFSWANPSWVRTWSKIRGEFWGEEIEKKDKEDKEDDGVLVLQEYGDKTVWEKHFQYILPFFRDPRYIKIERKPVFIISSSSLIPCLEQMIDEWKKLSLKNGLAGIYIICQDQFYTVPGMDAVLFSEPMQSIKKMQRDGKLQVKNSVRCFDYKAFYEKSLEAASLQGIKSYFGGACGYDTTPRRGRNGEVLVNNTPALFGEYLTKLLEKAVRFSNEFVVINAWNEWAEGMHLEPDEKNKFAYLEEVLKAKEIVTKEIEEGKLTIEQTDQIEKSTSDEQSFLIRRLSANREIYSRWIDLLSEDKLNFKSKLNDKGFRKIAIYGYGDLGRKLHFQLIKERADIRFAIDQYVGSVKDGLRVYRKEEPLPDADVIIVTAYEANQIREELQSLVSIPIMTLWELLE